MSTLISLVGQQPAAVAVVVKTLSQALAEQDPLRRVLLLPTLKTHPVALKLQSELRLWGLDVEIREISHKLTAIPHPTDMATLLLPAPQLIRHRLEEIGVGDGQVYFDVSPGMNFQISAIAQSLREVDITPIFADDLNLNVLEAAGSWPLANLGMESILRLYHLAVEGTRTEDGKWQDASLMRRLKRGGKAKTKTSFDCLYEMGGRVYTKVVIKGWSTEQERYRARSMARSVKALQRDPRKLNFLRPRVLVLTDNRSVQYRLRAHGIDVVSETSRDPGKSATRLQKWMQGNVKSPGSLQPGERDRFPPEPCLLQEGKGGENDPLIVALGNDPSATLLAICSHRPRQVLLCYDRKTDFVRALAGRFVEKAKDLPFNTLSLVPSDHLGNSLKKSLPQWIGDSGERHWYANTSPGTKAQAWSLASIAGVEVCTLNTSTSKVESIDGKGLFDFSPPSILMQAFICGGPLDQRRLKTMNELRRLALPYREFLRVMAQVVVHLAERKQFGGVSLMALKGRKGEFIVDYEVRGDTTEVTVRKDGKLYSGKLPGQPNEGFWLEPIVAYALYEAGKDLVSDLAFPLSWHELRREEYRGPFPRTELDAALRWRNSFLAVSCKANFPDEEHYWSARDEVVGVARTNLGRFCLPILVGPVPFQGRSVSDVSGRLLEIPLRRLDDRDYLRNAIEDYILQQRTT